MRRRRGCGILIPMGAQPLSLQCKTLLAVAFGFAALCTVGCAHQSEARCAYRPASPETPPAAMTAKDRDWYRRRETVLQTAREYYEKEMRVFRAMNPDLGERGQNLPNFREIEEYLRYSTHGEFLYEQLDDGHWAYRCDDLTRLLALSLYRWAIYSADYEKFREEWERERSTRSLFCSALQKRPEVILDVVKKEGLSPDARRFFEAARRIPGCVPERGWRTKSASPRPPYDENPFGD